MITNTCGSRPPAAPDTSEPFPEYDQLVAATKGSMADPFLSSGYNPKRNSLIIGIPTYNSGDYIGRSLQNLKHEFQDLRHSSRITLDQLAIFVCVNGADNQNRSNAVKDIEHFKHLNSWANLQIIVTDTPGKNNAMNQIIRRARAEQFEHLHFMDDDVEFRPGSLVENIETLQKHRDDEPLLVASHFQPYSRDINYFKARSNTTTEACAKKIMHSILSFPFDYEHTFPFASGQSLAGRVAELPLIPSDKSGITDDSFISYYYSVKGHDNQNHDCVIKPKESVVYFEVGASPKEWLRQQTRTLAGVLRAKTSFGPDRHYADRKYHFPTDKPYTFDYTKLSATDRFRLQAYTTLSKSVYKNAMNKINNAEHVQWGTAYSTKPVQNGDISNTYSKRMDTTR